MDAVKQAAAQHGSIVVRRQHHIRHDLLTVGLNFVPPVRSVRDLGISLIRTYRCGRTHTDCAQLFCGSATDRSISRPTSRSVLQSSIVSLVLSRLDYVQH